MFTLEQANTAIAKCDAKIDFFEELIARIVNTIDEIEMARHDNVLWDFGDNWTLADNVKDGWDATETACEGLGYVREVCERQLTRERNKAEKLEAYGTRLEGQATPAKATTNSVDIEDDEEAEDGAHCFDCGKYVADAHDMELGMWVQPSRERGTVNKKRFEYNDRYYAEFVCRECYDKHYRQCDKCGDSYHESRCTQDTNGNFICENCRNAQADTKVTTNSVDIDDEAEALNTNWKVAQRQLDKRITVEMQGGGTCAIDKDSDIRLTKIKDGYAFVDYGEVVAVGSKVVLGKYDTPAQVKEVIGNFGKSIFGNRFEFPHVEDVGKSDIEIAEELTAFLLKVTPLTAGFMDLTLQDGKTTASSPRTATIEPDWHGNGRFVFITPWNEIFARYDTASQVRTVIYRIKHAVEDKRDKFKYPTLAELTAPDYHEKRWAVDFDIYHEDSNLTDAELESYTDKLREALTANGNRACVELEDSLITIYGDNGGDNETVDNIIGEMSKRGCWVEYPEDAIDPIE